MCNYFHTILFPDIVSCTIWVNPGSNQISILCITKVSIRLMLFPLNSCWRLLHSCLDRAVHTLIHGGSLHWSGDTVPHGSVIFLTFGDKLIAVIFILACFNTCTELRSSCSQYFLKDFLVLSRDMWLMVLANAGLERMISISPQCSK